MVTTTFEWCEFWWHFTFWYQWILLVGLKDSWVCEGKCCFAWYIAHLPQKKNNVNYKFQVLYENRVLELVPLSNKTKSLKQFSTIFPLIDAIILFVLSFVFCLSCMTTSIFNILISWTHLFLCSLESKFIIRV